MRRYGHRGRPATVGVSTITEMDEETRVGELVGTEESETKEGVNEKLK